jgi:hypothetical protein
VPQRAGAQTASNKPRQRSYPEGMGKVWVLQTETKGTGANMVPLERTTRRASAAEPVFVPREAPPRPEPEPEPRMPRKFKVVDVMTRETLVDAGSARDAVEVLKDARSLVDVDVYVWQPVHERWRMLTSPERHAMWELAGR